MTADELRDLLQEARNVFHRRGEMWELVDRIDAALALGRGEGQADHAGLGRKPDTAEPGERAQQQNPRPPAAVESGAHPAQPAPVGPVPGQAGEPQEECGNYPEFGGCHLPRGHDGCCGSGGPIPGENQ